MGVHHHGSESERGREGEGGALIFAGTGEGDAEIKVRLRQTMEQSDGAERGIDGLLIIAERPVNIREAEWVRALSSSRATAFS